MKGNEAMKYIGLIISCCLLPITQAHGAPGKIAAEARRKVELERVRAEADARVAEERRRLEAEAARLSLELRAAKAHAASEERLGGEERTEERPAAAAAAEASTLDASDPASGAAVGGAAAAAPDSALAELRVEIDSARAALKQLQSFRAGIARVDGTTAVVDAMHLRLDGTKEYTTKKPRLSEDAGKTYNEKIDLIVESVAQDLADILLRDFFSVITKARGVLHVGGQPLTEGKDSLSELVRKFIHRSADRTLWARMTDAHAPAEIIARRRVALGLGVFVLGVLKPEDIGGITSQALLKEAIKRQLWLKDLSFIIGWMKNALVPQDYTALYGTRAEETRDEKVASEIRLMLNGIPEGRAQESFRVLSENRFLVTTGS